MASSLSSYADWKAPAQDGEALIWPDPAKLLEQTRGNHHSLGSAEALVQGIPLSQLRSRQRAWLNLEDDRLVVATGHQTELIHPGVWAKNALLHAVAARLDAEAIHFSVDTDAPKHLKIRWPGGSVPITDDPRLTNAAWSGLLDAPTPSQVQAVAASLGQAARNWAFKPEAQEFVDYLRPLSLEPGKLCPMLVNAMHQVDWSLGLRHQALIVSPLLMSPPYLAFVYHVLARAGEFASVYNQALHEYRVAHRLRTTARPMPDLLVGDECEIAFWMDDLTTETRSRASVHRHENQWKLVVGHKDLILSESTDGWQAAAELGNFLRQSNCRLSPRALTLTACLRLLIADQFVHGIGGGRYDQVTDRVIERFFHVAAPKFSVTTATLYFPEAVGRARACLPCIEQQGHRIRHELLGEKKMEMVRQIEQLPRKSIERQLLFTRMHNARAAAIQTHPSIQRWREGVEEAAKQSHDDDVLFDRELFYAIQPRARLEQVIEKYGHAFL